MKTLAHAKGPSIEPALVVILAGVCAALHVGKLPPALPVLQQELGISLLQSGFLLSLVQLAGMSAGLFIGLLADGIGLRRSLLIGLSILGVSSLLGASAKQPQWLLIWRAIEGLGFLLVVLPAPNLIRQLVRPERMSIMMGVWGAYMPLGTGLALLLGPALIIWAGWQSLWWGLAALSFGMLFWVIRVVPVAVKAPTFQQDGVNLWLARLWLTLRSSGPWLAALTFAAYSAQWLAVIGFLPTIYAQAGFPSSTTALLTALVALANIIGNLMSGRLLARDISPQTLLYVGFVTMGLGAMLAFANGPWGPLPRFFSILLFSIVGGLVPATLFALSVRMSPSEFTVSTTVGWMQQWSALGQFAGPPLVALAAATLGDWRATWWVTCSFCLIGLGLAHKIGRRVG